MLFVQDIRGRTELQVPLSVFNKRYNLLYGHAKWVTTEKHNYLTKDGVMLPNTEYVIECPYPKPLMLPRGSHGYFSLVRASVEVGNRKMYADNTTLYDVDITIRQQKGFWLLFNPLAETIPVPSLEKGIALCRYMDVFTINRVGFAGHYLYAHDFRDRYWQMIENELKRKLYTN